MNLISPSMHRFLDFITIVIFAAAPTVFGMTGAAAIISYALAAIHLTLTLLTRFSTERGGIFPLALHGWIELAVGVVLIALPFVLGWSDPERSFYIGIGVVILIVRLVSRYDHRHVSA